MRKWLMTAVALCVLLVLLAGCNRQFYRVEKSVPGGDAVAGREAILAHGCATCHVIPNVAENAYVGPPLNQYARRHYIAGNLPNTAEALVQWIQFPQQFEPGTAMPDLNVSENDARNIAAYLYEH
jgi:cytochrome c1